MKSSYEKVARAISERSVPEEREVAGLVTLRHAHAASESQRREQAARGAEPKTLTRLGEAKLRDGRWSQSAWCPGVQR